VFQQLPSPLAGNRIIENFIGYVPIPIGIATNFVVNNITYLVPMAIEEPSVIAAASSAAQFIAKHGGFRSSSSDSKMIGQIQMIGMEDLDLFVYQVKEIEPKLRDRANLRLLSMAARGGGLKEIRTRRLAASAQVRQFYKPEEMAVVELIIDVCDAMGANIVNTVCEDLG
jgi:hydroxymethylglutaryl-CoA reductase